MTPSYSSYSSYYDPWESRSEYEFRTGYAAGILDSLPAMGQGITYPINRAINAVPGIAQGIVSPINKVIRAAPGILGSGQKPPEPVPPATDWTTVATVGLVVGGALAVYLVYRMSKVAEPVSKRLGGIASDLVSARTGGAVKSRARSTSQLARQLGA